METEGRQIGDFVNLTHELLWPQTTWEIEQKVYEEYEGNLW